jgi:pilus assembly protein CpaE
VIGTVFSPKGGTGKTVIATSLAVTLAKQAKRTLLLDLDLQFGDAALMLGMEPEKTLADLVAAPGDLDGEKLAGYVTRHSSGLDVLPAPLQPENAELVSDEKLGRVFEVARESYEAIVVDTAPLFHGAMLTTLDWTDSLLLVCSRDVTGLKNVHLGLRTLSLLAFPTDRVALVINSPHGEGTLKRSEVENALGLDARAELPYDRGVPDAVNRGVPIVLAHKGAFAGGISQLTQSLVPASSSERRQRQRRWLPALGRA